MSRPKPKSEKRASKKKKRRYPQSGRSIFLIQRLKRMGANGKQINKPDKRLTKTLCWAVSKKPAPQEGQPYFLIHSINIRKPAYIRPRRINPNTIHVVMFTILAPVVFCCSAISGAITVFGSAKTKAATMAISGTTMRTKTWKTSGTVEMKFRNNANPRKITPR